MDGTEKRVFRRKHALLSTLLQPSPTYLRALHKQGILQETMATQVQEAPEKEKMSTLLTLLEASQNNTLVKIIYMLEQSGHDWVADEIHADLQWEKGKLQIENYIHQEAVYFTNTLLSDRGFIDLSRKDDLSVIIASRHQVAKEAWKRQMNRKSQKVKAELQALQQDVMHIFEGVDKVLIAKDRWRIKGGEDEKGQVRLAGAEGYTMSVRLLQDRLDKLQQVLENVISEYDKLLEERKQCYDIIGSNPEEGSLEVVLNNMLSKVTRELGQSTNTASLRKSQVYSLDKEVKALKTDLATQLDSKNIQIDSLQRTLLSTNRRLKDSSENLSDMTRKRDIYKTEAQYWKERTEVLEKTRRLGYYHFSRMHLPVPMTRHLLGTVTKKPIYFDPDLLEAEDNIVYIKGDAQVQNMLAADQQQQGVSPPNRLPSKGRRAVEQSSYEPSFKDPNTSPRKTQSLYHLRCAPQDENANTNNNNNKGNTQRNKPLLATKSTPNLHYSAKLNSVKTKEPNKKSQNDNTSSMYKATSQKKEHVYKGNQTPEIITSGINTSPYSRVNLSVLHTTPSHTNPHNSTGDQQGAVSYQISGHHTVPSGVYRPVLMSRTAPRSNTQATNEAIMSNNFFNYSEIRSGYEDSSVKSGASNTTSANQSTKVNKSPKDKFDEKVEAASVGASSSKSNKSMSIDADRESRSQEKGESVMSDVEVDSLNSSLNKSSQDTALHTRGDGHCRCCPQCCKEAPTSHVYQGCIG